MPSATTSCTATCALSTTPVGDGVPIALKDVISTKGIETTAGSKILAGYVPVFDATVAARCKDAGLPLIGKTNTDEFAMGSSTENSAYGPTHNPWDPERVPGGSGGGTAAAVSAGLAPWGLGSDTGGSIKQPSALCGNVGLRPTYGTVSRFGVVAFASSLDQVGPVAKNVRDCARLYGIISGRDPADSTTVEVPAVELPEGESLKGLRIGVPTELNEAKGIEPGVSAAVQKAIELARELGAEVGECSLPRSVDYGLACYYLIAPAEASSNLARYDGVRYGRRADADGYYEMVERTRDAGFGDEPKRRIMLGTYALSAGYYEAYYGQAQKVRTVIAREHAAAFERFDVLVSPTSPTIAFKLGEKAADPLAMYLSDLLTIPSCMAGLPGLNIPCGLSEGLPVGLQLIGPQLSENTLFRWATRSSAALGFDPVPERLRELTWEPVVGLEIHVQLKTRTKMFCRCANGFGGGENTQTCPVCLGFPGALPVANATAIEWTIKLGLALDCEIADARRLRAQELLLPGPAEGLSDLPIRSTVLHQRQGASADAGRRPRGRDRPRAPRGGRGEDHARRRPHGPDRRRRLLARRLQPRRHAARRDRDRARHPLRRGRAPLPAAAAADDRRARDLRRGDGEGARCASMRTSRCGRRDRRSCARAAS